jgi:hypothetical protein
MLKHADVSLNTGGGWDVCAAALLGWVGSDAADLGFKHAAPLAASTHTRGIRAPYTARVGVLWPQVCRPVGAFKASYTGSLRPRTLVA